MPTAKKVEPTMFPIKFDISYGMLGHDNVEFSAPGVLGVPFHIEPYPEPFVVHCKVNGIDHPCDTYNGRAVWDVMGDQVDGRIDIPLSTFNDKADLQRMSAILLATNIQSRLHNPDLTYVLGAFTGTDLYSLFLKHFPSGMRLAIQVRLVRNIPGVLWPTREWYFDPRAGGWVRDVLTPSRDLFKKTRKKRKTA